MRQTLTPDNTIEVLEDIKGDTGEITNALTFLKGIDPSRNVRIKRKI